MLYILNGDTGSGKSMYLKQKALDWIKANKTICYSVKRIDEASEINDWFEVNHKDIRIWKDYKDHKKELEEYDLRITTKMDFYNYYFTEDVLIDDEEIELNKLIKSNPGEYIAPNAKILINGIKDRLKNGSLVKLTEQETLICSMLCSDMGNYTISEESDLLRALISDNCEVTYIRDNKFLIERNLNKAFKDKIVFLSSASYTLNHKIFNLNPDNIYSHSISKKNIHTSIDDYCPLTLKEMDNISEFWKNCKKRIKGDSLIVTNEAYEKFIPKEFHHCPTITSKTRGINKYKDIDNCIVFSLIRPSDKELSDLCLYMSYSDIEQMKIKELKQAICRTSRNNHTRNIFYYDLATAKSIKALNNLMNNTIEDDIVVINKEKAYNKDIENNESLRGDKYISNKVIDDMNKLSKERYLKSYYNIGDGNLIKEMVENKKKFGKTGGSKSKRERAFSKDEIDQLKLVKGWSKIELSKVLGISRKTLTRYLK